MDDVSYSPNTDEWSTVCCSYHKLASADIFVSLLRHEKRSAHIVWRRRWRCCMLLLHCSTDLVSLSPVLLACCHVIGWYMHPDWLTSTLDTTLLQQINVVLKQSSVINGKRSCLLRKSKSNHLSHCPVTWSNGYDFSFTSIWRAEKVPGSIPGVTTLFVFFTILSIILVQ